MFRLRQPHRKLKLVETLRRSLRPENILLITSLHPESYMHGSAENQDTRSQMPNFGIKYWRYVIGSDQQGHLRKPWQRRWKSYTHITATTAIMFRLCFTIKLMKTTRCQRGLESWPFLAKTDCSNRPPKKHPPENISAIIKSEHIVTCDKLMNNKGAELDKIFEMIIEVAVGTKSG